MHIIPQAQLSSQGHFFHRGYCHLLHIRQHMTVCIHRYLNGAMPQPFLNYFGIDTLLQQQRRVCTGYGYPLHNPA
jgi:hypothetical protein